MELMMKTPLVPQFPVALTHDVNLVQDANSIDRSIILLNKMRVKQTVMMMKQEKKRMKKN